MHVMQRPTRARSDGAVAAILAGIVATGTAALYVGWIVAQGDEDLGSIVLVTVWILGLAACAFAGAVRNAPDRVIPLGAATVGLLGAAVVSLFSIGVLLLIAGISALVAWVRAGSAASRRDQLLAGLAGVGAALGFLAVVLVV